MATEKRNLVATFTSDIGWTDNSNAYTEDDPYAYTGDLDAIGNYGACPFATPTYTPTALDEFKIKWFDSNSDHVDDELQLQVYDNHTSTWSVLETFNSGNQIHTSLETDDFTTELQTLYAAASDKAAFLANLQIRLIVTDQTGGKDDPRFSVAWCNFTYEYAEVPLEADVYDDLTLTDDVIAELPVLEISVFDTITATDSVQLIRDNDFNLDSACVAVWNLEPSALTVDSKGGNDFSSNNGVTSDSSEYKQGLGSGFFESSNYDYLKLTDTELDAGFPYKVGSNQYTFSFCCWFRPNNLGSIQALFSKDGESLFSIAAELLSTSRIRFYFSYGAGTEDYIHGATLEEDKWYHLALTYDDNTQDYRIRIHDENGSIGIDKVGTTTNQPIIRAGDFSLGNNNLLQGFDGNIDEAVMFTKALSISEIDQIWSGIYGHGQILQIDLIGVTDVVIVEIPILEITVYDAITVTEDLVVTRIEGSLSVNVDDSITVTDSTVTLINLAINVNDAITLQDIVLVDFGILEINVSDNISLTDIVITELVNYEVSVNDSITIADFADTTLVTNLSIYVYDYVYIRPAIYKAGAYDTITLTEDVTLALSTGALTVSVYDDITIADYTEALVPTLFIAVSDAITLSEVVNALVSTLFINVYDSISLADNIDVTIPVLEILVSDSVTVSDEVTISRQELGTLVINVYDTITLTEDVVNQFDLYEVLVSDSLTITDSVSTAIPILEVIVSDSISLTDTVNALVPLLLIATYDDITISDDIAVEFPVYEILTSDAISLTDNIDIQIPVLVISVDDDITISDVVSNKLPVYEILVFDDTIVSDVITITTASPALSVSIFDNITVSDSITIHRIIDFLDLISTMQTTTNHKSYMNDNKVRNEKSTIHEQCVLNSFEE